MPVIFLKTRRGHDGSHILRSRCETRSVAAKTGTSVSDRSLSESAWPIICGYKFRARRRVIARTTDVHHAALILSWRFRSAVTRICYARRRRTALSFQRTRVIFEYPISGRLKIVFFPHAVLCRRLDDNWIHEHPRLNGKIARARPPIVCVHFQRPVDG